VHLPDTIFDNNLHKEISNTMNPDAKAFHPPPPPEGRTNIMDPSANAFQPQHANPPTARFKAYPQRQTAKRYESHRQANYSTWSPPRLMPRRVSIGPYQNSQVYQGPQAPVHSQTPSLNDQNYAQGNYSAQDNYPHQHNYSTQHTYATQNNYTAREPIYDHNRTRTSQGSRGSTSRYSDDARSYIGPTPVMTPFSPTLSEISATLDIPPSEITSVGSYSSVAQYGEILSKPSVSNPGNQAVPQHVRHHKLDGRERGLSNSDDYNRQPLNTPYQKFNAQAFNVPETFNNQPVPVSPQTFKASRYDDGRRSSSSYIPILNDTYCQVESCKSNKSCYVIDTTISHAQNASKDVNQSSQESILPNKTITLIGSRNWYTMPYGNILPRTIFMTSLRRLVRQVSNLMSSPPSLHEDLVKRYQPIVNLAEETLGKQVCAPFSLYYILHHVT